MAFLLMLGGGRGGGDSGDVEERVSDKRECVCVCVGVAARFRFQDNVALDRPNKVTSYVNLIYLENSVMKIFSR